MLDYEYLSASDGTGPAVTANIESGREIGATTLNVDSVENMPAKFILVTGTVDSDDFIDPATMTEMYCSLSGTDIEIDGFAPGYSDAGNTEGQVCVIKQTTQWADEAARLALIAHNPDGTSKDKSVPAEALGTPIAFRCNGNTTSVPNTTYTKVAWTEVEDLGENFDLSRFTAPYDGWYLFSFGLMIENLGVDKFMFASIYKNGAAFRNIKQTTATGGSDATLTPSLDMSLVAGDYIEIWVYHNSGSTEIVNTAFSFFGGHLTGRTD